ncbi:TerD family protein [Abditibacterium utsteinense]|nr:TerD family protein [Abditibacterium utsteinense]
MKTNQNHLIRGQRIKLTDLASEALATWRVELSIEAPGKVIDYSCFGLDSNRKLSDDRYFVFYNQPRSPDGCISWQADSDTSAQFTIDLKPLPPSIKYLVFTATLDGSGSMSQIRQGKLQIIHQSVPAVYSFAGSDFDKETAIILGEIYHREVWRIAAVGQGFAGGLSALLKHFGGQEIEDGTQNPASSQAAPKTPPAPIQPTSLPVSSPTLASPALASIFVAPPPLAAPNLQNALQKAINEAPNGSTLQLARGEFRGPILVDKPLILEGNGAVIWAQNGPVVRVSGAGVTLRNLEIEATAPDAESHSDVALWIDEGANTLLQEVRARGEIVGVAAAQGTWKLPPLLDLGEFAARETNSFQFEIEVPHACDLKINISGLSVVPPRVEAGRAKLEVRAGGVGNDTFLTGYIELSSGGVGRTIPLHGRSVDGAPPARGVWLWRVDSPSIPA